MSNCDIGFERHSPRDQRFLQFVADGPGIAGFRLAVDPEVDNDEMVQLCAGANAARVAENDLRLNRADDWALVDSLEALAAESGFEPADPSAEEAIEAYEDAEEISDLPPHLVAQFDESDGEDDGWPDEDEHPEESSIMGLDPKYLVERPAGLVSVFRSREVEEQVNAGRRRQGAPRFNTETICQRRVEAVQPVGDVIVVSEQKAAAAAKPEPAKGNGERRQPVTPPVGKFLAGTVIDQGPKGLLVDIGGFEARVPIALEMGHGSWDAAAKWILGFKPGASVRIRVIRVNGVIEAVIADRHPRPWWRKKETIEQQAPAAN